jgi:hypothetical protein
MNKFRSEIKHKILSSVGIFSEFLVDAFGKGVDIGFSSIEYSQKILYSKKTENFWALGKLYRLKKELQLNFLERMFESEDVSLMIFPVSNFETIKNKSTIKDFIEKNYCKRFKLNNNDYFMILQKENFSFGDCALQILLKDKVCLLILNRDQSKKPWKYFEYENL